MRVARPAAYTAALLAGSLLMNVVLVSCAAESTGLDDNAAVLARLDAMTARLATIEAKLDSSGARTIARLDSLQSGVTTIGGTPTLSPLQAAQLDSVVAIASFIANDAVSGGWEACVNVEAGLSGAIASKADATGEGAGSLGAWAGTGAFAGAKIDAKNEIGFEFNVDGGGSIEGCLPLGGEAPPARALRASMRSGDGARLEGTISTFTGQLGLTEARVEAALASLGSALSGSSVPRIQDISGIVPLPPLLANRLANPQSVLSGEVAGKVTDAINSLCSASWGSQLSSPVATACANINSGNVSIGGLYAIASQFPAVESALTTLQGRFSTACGRINTIGVTSLTIPNPLNIGPEPLFGPQRLFPSFTTVAC